MLDDTIAAVATASGEGGIAVIRISGPGAPGIAANVFRPRSGADVTGFAGYTVHYGEIVDRTRGNAIDDALLTMFRAPRSYTGEDVCELACHGGSTTTGVVLDLVLKSGARIALPGEFTQRAFLNGRMDLAQAEAVADLVRARTESARKLARRQLEGDVSRAAAAIREDLIGIVAAIEVTIDFSDEVGDLQYIEICDRLDRAMLDILRLLGSAGKGRVLREGLNVAIVGRPNVGKSTLMNAILKSERAIVTPIPGTTRDTIEESVAISGLPVVLTDTAGMRETDDPVERIGVDRARDVIGRSDMSLFVLDASEGFTADDIVLAHFIRETCDNSARNCIIVLNKGDLVCNDSLNCFVIEASSRLELPGAASISISAATRSGIGSLEDLIVSPYLNVQNAGGLANADPIASVVVSNSRHSQALESARISLVHAVESARNEMPGDFIALDVRGALDALGQITGETVTEDIIHRVFKDFCVGK